MVMTSCETLDDFKHYINVAVRRAEPTDDWIAVEVLVGYELLPVSIIGNSWYAMRDDVRTVRDDRSIRVIATYLVQMKGGAA